VRPITPRAPEAGAGSRLAARPDLAHLREVAAGVAYRMVGTRIEAEDLAQEALVRLHTVAGRQDVRNPEAFVTTIVSRLAIDHLRLARVQRERYPGPWLPEPVSRDVSGDGARAAEVADTLSFALMVVLEELGPVERAAFLLRDVFGYDYAEVGRIVDRNEPAVRQLVVRARRRVAARGRRRSVSAEDHRRLVDRFLAAARDGDVDGLRDLLAEDAVLVSDGGPKRKAARHPIRGRHRMVRFLRTVGPKTFADDRLVSVVDLDGQPGYVVQVDGSVHLAGTVEVGVPDGVDEPRINRVPRMLNPDKLGAVVPPAGGRRRSRRAAASPQTPPGT
jgi:RNA polymerase sigma-70 factor (ECF subfamily)